MLKSLALAVVLLAGTAAAASEGVDLQTQIYVVAGVLGGVCLLLTIAAIFSIVATIKLQTKVAVLQSSTKAAAMEPPPSFFGSPRFNPMNYYNEVRQESPGRPAPPPRPYRAAPAREYY